MRVPFTGLGVLASVWLAISLGAQTNLPAFEVASVKPNNSGTTIANNGRVTGDRFMAMNATVIQLMRAAYGIQEFQIAGPPGWAGIERFDITAKIAAGARPEEWPAMLQHLLAERFRLTLHREQRQTNGYALTVARGGIKLTPVDPSKCAPPNGSCGFSASPTEIVARGQSMDQLAARLSRSIGQTVVNRTDVSGIFDFKVEWTLEDQFREPGATASPAVFTALTEQLGLRLQSQRTAVEVLVIDRVERPTAN